MVFLQLFAASTSPTTLRMEYRGKHNMPQRKKIWYGMDFS
jgi:hypothetical protein